MPSIQTITLADVDTGASTATFVFTPVMPQNGSTPASWQNAAKANRLSREVITAALVRSEGANPADRFKISVLIPIPMTVEGVTTYPTSYRADVDIRLPDAGSSDLDQEVLSMLSKLLADASIITAITQRVAIY